VSCQSRSLAPAAAQAVWEEQSVDKVYGSKRSEQKSRYLQQLVTPEIHCTCLLFRSQAVGTAASRHPTSLVCTCWERSVPQLELSEAVLDEVMRCRSGFAAYMDHAVPNTSEAAPLLETSA